ncbi:MAG: phosphate ABC transporter substrate-binding protein [Pirellulales bacterium]|nr:phosphate ABC transporter substrate-binding protein [Pirellulales bacterium]
MFKQKFSVMLALAAIGCLIPGCKRADRGVRVEGSDTMVNLAQAWAEKYHADRPDISIQVLGGGTGVGITSMIDGNCDLATASRKMEAKEIQRVKERRGCDAIEHLAGYDALAVYVHKDNPLDTISLEQLAEIYGDGGKIDKWSQLGIDGKTLGTDEITRVSRQNSSGTYAYFREAVLGKKRDYKNGAVEQTGSKDVVALVAHTPGAIGYSGMGYKEPGVKMLKIAKKKGEPGVEPTVATAKNNTYPITRPLLIYSAGEPTGKIKDFLDWIHSSGGQKVVLELGYVPIGDHE